MVHNQCEVGAGKTHRKILKVWVQVSKFPPTGSGKIQKNVLHDGFVAGMYDGL